MNAPQHKNDDDFFGFIRTLIWAGAIAIVFRAFLFEPFSIPSGSMVPNLLVGDYLFVSKFSYGYSAKSVGLGFLERWFGVPLPKERFLASPLKRGDVVVFKLPADNATDYVKRLIGLPGERVQVKEGRLYVNGEMVPREVVGSFSLTGNDLDEDHNYFRRAFNLPSLRYIETLPGGVKHDILELSDEAPLDNTKEFVVPEGHYFMMGDNRDNSQDSRVQTRVGFVPADNIVGRAEIIFFSLKNSPFWQIWNWPTHMRYERMVKIIR